MIDPTSGGIETSLITEGLKVGVVGMIAVLFAAVIRFLYREGKDDRKAIEAERKIWNAERETLKAEHAKCVEVCKTDKETLRADYERRNRECLEGYTHQLQIERDGARKREDDIRREMLQVIEKSSSQVKVSSDALAEMLDNVLTKIVK